MSLSANAWEFFWKTVGLSGQALFGLRLLVQWNASEKAHRSVIPLSFWYISVIAGWLLLLYAIYRVEPIFIIGFVINYLIYIRNLDMVFRDYSRSRRRLLWLNAAMLLVAAIVYAVSGPKAPAVHESPHIAFWYIWGLTGQICFNLRFPLQWLHSEARGHSEMPPVFWYLSLIGSLMLLSYAVFLRDLVFIIGQAFGFTVYIRNIALLRRRV